MCWFLLPLALFLVPFLVIVAFLKRNPNAARDRGSAWSGHVQNSGGAPDSSLGEAGEMLLHSILSAKLDKDRFRILHNIMLPTDDGATTQIDHIVVSQGGVFVIETKTYGNGFGRRAGSCWIFGNPADREWTVSYPGGKKFRFQNPIRQNFKHIATLSECLGIPKEYFKSVIAFSGTAKFKTELPPEVMTFHTVPGFLLAHASDNVIKREQLSEVANVILEWQASLDAERKAAHVANLRKKHPAKPPPLPGSFRP